MPTWERGRPARTSLGTATLISSHQSTGNGVAKELSTKLHEERPRATKGFGAAFPSHPAWRGKGDVMRGFPRERGRPARTSLGTASLISSHQSTGNGVAKELSTKLHEERPRATKGFGAAFPSHPAWRGKGAVMRGFPLGARASRPHKSWHGFAYRSHFDQAHRANDVPGLYRPNDAQINDARAPARGFESSRGAAAALSRGRQFGGA